MSRLAIVIFPRLAQLAAIQHFRETYDPLAALIPPHLTLVFPFESDLSTEDCQAHMARVTQAVRPFRVGLWGVSGQAGEYLFLNVKRGNDQIIALHDQLYSDVLAPYLDLRETYVPHMTIGRVSTDAAFTQALREAQQSLSDFIATDVSEISAYEIAPEGTRSVVCTVPLAEM